jgi:hypothetical protein
LEDTFNKSSKIDSVVNKERAAEKALVKQLEKELKYKEKALA